MPLAFSTFPEDWGLQEQCKWYSIPRDFDTPWITVAWMVKPLSLWRLFGSPNLGISSCLKIVITSLTCSLHQGKPSVYPENISTQTCKQENPCVFIIWVKGTTTSFIIHKSWTSLYLSFDFFTPKIGVVYGLLQEINSPCSFKFSMMSFNT